ncbi:MAG: tripartite tricarboxylate transporter permease [Deltaproteobacteria bacterium]|jgi:putative tricarboxylic transport membrane protein|nr:tripartite tricarboxylate transporter permease [Deltaproteobacteria bacterium]
MDMLAHIALGVQTLFTPTNILFCFLGVLMGTLVGVLPGLGPTAAIALLLPNTFHVTPVTAIIMLAGIYYGAMYGGSTTSILVNIPGEAASVITCLDGYQMALKGRAGPALGIAAFGSFIAGTISVLGLMLVAPPLAKFALAFGPPEYFSLMLMGIVVLIYLASGSILKALMIAVFGLLLGTIGMDAISGTQRLTFGVLELADGIGLIPAIMGLFGVAEVISNVEEEMKREIITAKVKNLLPNLRDWKDSFWPIIRGSFLGFFIGILPGPAPVISAFTSYAIEKKISKHPEKFGTGVIEGVAGPESANNAATGGAFIPLFTLGIPANSVIAILLGAFMIHGIQPGPMLISKYPDLFWGTIMSMYLGNIMLLILNLPLIGLWVKVLKVPYPILFPLILLFCLVGVFSLNYSNVEVALMIGFGIFGYLARKFQFEMAPLVLAIVIGPMMENNLRLALTISQGDPWIFIQKPISAVFMIVSLVLLISPFIPWLGKRREKLREKVEGEEV